MASTQSDFVNIQLSAAGLEMAGRNGAVRVTSRHINYFVAAGSSVRVLTSEWSRVLSQLKSGAAQIFEIVPAQGSMLDASLPVPKTSPAPAAAPATRVAPGAKEEK